MAVMRELSEMYPFFKGRTFLELQEGFKVCGLWLENEKELCEFMLLYEEERCATLRME